MVPPKPVPVPPPPNRPPPVVLVDVFPNNPPAAGVDVPKAPGVPKPDVAAIKEVYVPNLFACKTVFLLPKQLQ